VGSPEGSSLRRQGETREHGDVGEAATHVRRTPAAAALDGGPSVGRDEGSNLTHVINYCAAELLFEKLSVHTVSQKKRC